MPSLLSFISSKTEDWGYLNEDGELGLAYQGLKQVARSNIHFSACACFVCPACSCLRLTVSRLEWRQGHDLPWPLRLPGGALCLSRVGEIGEAARQGPGGST